MAVYFWGTESHFGQLHVGSPSLSVYLSLGESVFVSYPKKGIQTSFSAIMFHLTRGKGKAIRA